MRPPITPMTPPAMPPARPTIRSSIGDPPGGRAARLGPHVRALYCGIDACLNTDDSTFPRGDDKRVVVVGLAPRPGGPIPVDLPVPHADLWDPEVLSGGPSRRGVRRS